MGNDRIDIVSASGRPPQVHPVDPLLTFTVSDLYSLAPQKFMQGVTWPVPQLKLHGSWTSGSRTIRPCFGKRSQDALTKLRAGLYFSLP
jgi:hypothetical protein